MKQQLLQFFNTIRFKLILIFLILFLIPFVLVETIIYKNIEENALKDTNGLMVNNLRLVSDYTTTFLSDIQTDFQNIIFQEDFILALFKVEDLGAITTQYQLDATEKLSDDFEPYLESDRIDSVYLFNRDNKVFYDFSYLSPSYLVKNFEETLWYQQYVTAYHTESQSFHKNWLITESIPHISRQSPENLVSYYTRFKSTSGQITILSVNVNVEQLIGVIDSLSLPEGASIYISDEDGYIVASNHLHYIGDTLEDLYGLNLSKSQTITVHEEKRHITAYTNNPLNFSYVIDIPYSYITSTAQESRTLMYGLYLIIIGIILTMNIVIQRFLLKPINAMISRMRHVEQGNFDITLPDNRKDELGVLYKNFNDMTRNIHNLIEKNYIEVLQRKQSDLNYIQTQLNEHFLYNTLDAIYSLILTNDQTRAQEMLLSLSKFFRTTLNNGKQVITIGEIVSMLEHYTTIMRLRNNGKYTIDIKVHKDVEDVYALKFLFQPILENAIIHGVSSRKQGGRICVIISKNNDLITYKVWDNGKGIDPQRLHRINTMLKETTTTTQNEFFALNNIVNQAKLFYKDGFNIHIKSTLYEFTECIIEVPVLTSPPQKGVLTYD